MTCTDCINRDTAPQPSSSLSLGLILLVLGGMAVVASAPTVPDRMGSADIAAEDWHGNVRASGWTND
ncbi:hypothetical protein QKW60_13195 [Defluviimonas aestuarii]|uniref:hypothetical protein n=1 Tax=Albidovulum aestuarii TaxID=1130726 RepID=UPI00249AE1EE|nr:hypothetical protein [Defluviimonas aestuarii]MDI3337369.1 hypothetical protein [Defluviimonas aestuarii]